MAPGRVVGVPVDLVVTDATGTTTLGSTLVVSRDPSPAVRVPLSQQIAGFGPSAQQSFILSYPDRDFSFAFRQRHLFPARPELLRARSHVHGRFHMRELRPVPRSHLSWRLWQRRRHRRRRRYGGQKWRAAPESAAPR